MNKGLKFFLDSVFSLLNFSKICLYNLIRKKLNRYETYNKNQNQIIMKAWENMVCSSLYKNHMKLPILGHFLFKNFQCHIFNQTLYFYLNNRHMWKGARREKIVKPITASYSYQLIIAIHYFVLFWLFLYLVFY